MRKIDINQGSLEWHQARWGKVTGTSLKSAVGSPKAQQTLALDLVAQRMTEPQIMELETPAVIRGRELEGFARQKVIEATGINFIASNITSKTDNEFFNLV